MLDVTENGRVMWLEEAVGKIIFGVLCDRGKGGLQSLCSRPEVLQFSKYHNINVLLWEHS